MQAALCWCPPHLVRGQTYQLIGTALAKAALLEPLFEAGKESSGADFLAAFEWFVEHWYCWLCVCQGAAAWASSDHVLCWASAMNPT